VTDGNGKTVDASYYEATYSYNDAPGTAMLEVQMIGHSAKETLYFKIYLPGTTETTVENIKTGIKINWKPVDGAAGYVVYRSAWNKTTGGWTKFDRWMTVNGMTNTSWEDTTVYACTKYRYGVKAFFAATTDPITGNPMGGATDNYNLGVVGPEIITVRITTRTLSSTTPGTGKITVKWDASYWFTGYQLQISTDSTFKKDVKTVEILDWETAKTTFSGLKAKTMYYVRMRSFHEFEKKNYYGQWSNVLNAKTN
jgi:hypothetical protein